MVYLDNAATSFPKPESVYTAVQNAMRECAGNPGRSGHKLSLAAERTVEEARRLVSQLFNVKRSERIIFILNATDALNLALGLKLTLLNIGSYCDIRLFCVAFSVIF